jgi:16S rRNA processing protein RimM
MIVMGRVRAPFGVKGWVKVHPYTETPEGLLAYREWWLASDDGWKRWFVREAAVHGANVIGRLEGCDDREAAAQLKGRDVAVPRRHLPRSAEGEFYFSDLLGLEVSTVRGISLGRVQHLIETGANLVLAVKGEKELLVPFVEGVVVELALDAGSMVVNWEGLD